jgi:hypothetical protein
MDHGSHLLAAVHHIEDIIYINKQFITDMKFIL